MMTKHAAGVLLSGLLLLLPLSARGQFSADEPPKKERTLETLLGEAPKDPPDRAADTDTKQERLLVVDAAEVAVADPPPKKALDEAIALIRELYKKEMDAAKTPPQLTELARTLLKQARDAKSDPAGHFVLLEEAAAVAAKGGDVITTFAALDQLARSFKVAELERKRDALVTLASTLPPSAHKPIADMALSLIDRAVDADDYSLAKDLAKIAGASARKAKDASASKTANLQASAIEKLAKEFADVKEAIGKLEKEPNDPDANLRAGTYYCFLKGNWAAGLPMLARGSDAKLKLQAEKDLENPTDAAACMAVADGWWDIADTQNEAAKGHVQVRASEWYSKAIPGSTGLAKAKAEKRLGDVSAEQIKGGKAGPVLPLFAKALTAVKGAKLNTVRPHGFGIGQTWDDIPEQGGVLVGIDVGLHPRDGSIAAVRGVYATARGEIHGKLIGTPTPRVVSIKAKPGYAIGSMTIHAGLHVDGLFVTFMQMQGDGLNADQNYKGEYVGGRGGRELEVAVPGEPIVGLHGHLHKDGRLASLGIVTPPPSP